MYDRHAISLIREAMADTRVIALTGPRQSGKTTLARTLAGGRHNYVSLDDPAILAAARSDPTGLIQRLDHAIIDEIQRAPDLTLALKLSVDMDQRPGRFIITGSADFIAMPRAVESLAGRVEAIPLLPLAQSEIAGAPAAMFLDNAFRGIVAAPRAPANDVVARVLTGGYPEAIARPSEHRRREWHRAYVAAILDRDVRDIAFADLLARMPDLFRLLATRSGQLVNWTSIANDIRIDAKTVESYVRLLEHLFLVRRLPAWSTNATQRLVSTPKLHFLDSGLLASILGMRMSAVALDRSPLGPVLESFVYAELQKMLPYTAAPLRMSHYRDKDQVEVDFVLEDPDGGVVGVEVKAASTALAPDFRGLRRLADRAGDRFRCGILLCDGPHTLPFGPKLFAAPVSALWSA
jgi:uncharacterized protein